MCKMKFGHYWVFTIYLRKYTRWGKFSPTPLRIGLRYHKKCHNFIDTHSLINVDIEDTNHFLFSCPFFVAQRATLASSVIQILQKCNLNHLGNQPHLYLYGHPIINLADNIKILLSTIKYTPTNPWFCHNHNHIIILVNILCYFYMYM